MDVRISDYVLNGERVLTTECSLCQTCITVCAHDALKLGFGFDLGGKDLLREPRRRWSARWRQPQCVIKKDQEC